MVLKDDMLDTIIVKEKDLFQEDIILMKLSCSGRPQSVETIEKRRLALLSYYNSKGGRTVNDQGYVLIKNRKHHRSGVNGASVNIF